jgi:signal transduction histidine kinase
VISDNGCGFDPDHVQSSGHYGLKFMRERTELLNGSFSVQSTPGKGTIITASLPYEEILSTKP